MNNCRLLTLLTFASLLFVNACTGGDNRNAQPTTPNVNTPATSTPSSPSPAASPATTHKKVNLNTATREEFFAAIPNLGNRMAHEFEEYRPYKSIQQFRKEIGKYVDQAQVAEYEKHVFVPINPNQSDAATLQQIPGLDASEAESLIAGRPYASPDAFLAKVAEKTSAADAEAARAMIEK